MRSAQVPISALVVGEQLSAISSSLSNTSNTSLGGCPPGSYPNALWLKYSESDKPHFRANIVTFFFSVTVTRTLIPTVLFLMRLQPHRGFGAVPVGFSAGCPVATLRPCLLPSSAPSDDGDDGDGLSGIPHPDN